MGFSFKGNGCCSSMVSEKGKENQNCSTTTYSATDEICSLAEAL